MSTISENIKRYRQLNNLLQRDLAEKLGKTTNVISNWETGLNTPDVDSILKLCHVLSVSPNMLFGMSSKTSEITSKFCKLSDEDQELILRFIDRML